MKKIVIAVIAIFAYALIADSAMAATAINTLDVTASVAESCSVTSTVNVAFGAYDPMSGADNIAGAGSFNFRCVKGATPIQLHIVRTGNMTNGVDPLAYTLYSDAARSIAWASAAAAPPNDSLDNPVPTTAVSNGVKTMLVLGKIVAGQDVGVGAYTETATVTVTY